MKKFRTFKQNKLIRDKIITFMQEHGSKMYWFTLSDHDFQKQLKIKLVEEAAEVQKTQTKQDLADELADVLELVHTLAKHNQIDLQELTQIQEKKREEKGGYDQKIFLTYAEHPKDGPAERYCLADPDKYPEVKNL